MSMGASQSKGSSEQQSESYISPDQLPFLADMWNTAIGATNVAGGAADASAVQGATMPGLQQGFNNTLALTDPTSQIQAQTASLQEGLGNMFQTQLMPAIAGNSISAGGFGGGRQGVAEGVAAGQLGSAFTQGLGDIVANANSTAIGAASTLPGMTQNMFQTAAAGNMGGLDQLARLSQILGSPTVLNRGSGSSRNSSQSVSAGII